MLTLLENERLSAFAVTSGDALWNVSVTVPRTPAIDRFNRVFAGYSSGRVVAFDGRTGKELWDYITAPRTRISTAPFVTGNATTGVVVAASTPDNLLMGINAASGALLWSYATGALLSFPPSVSPTGDTVYISLAGADVRAIDIHSGALVWRAALNGGTLFESPSVSPVTSTVHVGEFYANYSGTIHAIDGLTGVLNWSVEVSSLRTVSFSFQGSSGTAFASVFDWAGNCNLSRINADGLREWSHTMRPDSGSCMSVFDAKNDAVILYDKNRTVSLDAITGSTQWSTPSDGTVLAPLVLMGDGTVIVVSMGTGTGGGTIAALYTIDGVSVWSQKIGGGVRYEPVVSDGGTVIVAADDGVLYAVKQ